MRSKKLKIAVIGAGASGLTAAYRLKKRGYDNVTVFEREDRAGGKVNSYHYDGFNHELGQLWADVSYKTVMRIAQEVGVEYVEEDLYFELITDNGERTDFDKFLWDRYSFSRVLRSLVNFIIINIRYRNIFTKGFHKAHKNLFMNFADFIKKYKLEPLAETFYPFWIGCGYGYFEEVPALYVMPLFKSAITESVFDFVKGIFGVPVKRNLRILMPGQQSLWEKVAELLDVRFKSEVTSIKRLEKNDGFVVQVTANDETAEFDRVIFTSAPGTILKFADATDEEKELFGKVINYDYYVTLFRGRGREDDVNKLIFLLKYHNPAGIGHSVILFNRKATPGVWVSYQIARENADIEELHKILKDDLQDIDAEIDKVVTRKKWVYFPHVETKDLEEGFYVRLNNMQGSRGTYYAGGIMNFEMVENTVCFAERLVKKYF